MSPPSKRDNVAIIALNYGVQDFVINHLHTKLSTEIILEFSLQQPKVIISDIASGDQFISCNTEVQSLRDRLPTVACVEMEGAAVAQVCESFKVPFSVIRTISDSANDDVHIDFPKFIQEVAQVYTQGILHSLLSVKQS